MKLNIEKFEPKKAELTAMVNESKKLVIKDIDDKEGYALVVKAKTGLQKARTTIKNQGKEYRQEARDFASGVIKLEKELVAILTPEEDRLAEIKQVIDDEKLILQRQLVLPERIEKLATIEIDNISEDKLLSMDDVEFSEFYNQQKEFYLSEKERITEEKRLADEKKLQDAQDKLKQEQDQLAEDKRIKKAEEEADKKAKKAAIDDAKLAKLQADKDKEDAIQAERDLAKKDKEDLIALQEQADKDRIKAEEDAEEIRLEAEEKLQKKKKYQKFLKDNSYTEENKSDFHIQTTCDKVILYKKVGELKI